MTDGLWLGFAIGGSLGLLYGVAAYISVRFAARRKGNQFFVLYFAGMTIRLTIALASLLLMLALVSVHKAAVAGSFLGIVFMGIALEILSLQYGRLREAVDT